MVFSLSHQLHWLLAVWLAEMNYRLKPLTFILASRCHTLKQRFVSGPGQKSARSALSVRYLHDISVCLSVCLSQSLLIYLSIYLSFEIVIWLFFRVSFFGWGINFLKKIFIGDNESDELCKIYKINNQQLFPNSPQNFRNTENRKV